MEKYNRENGLCGAKILQRSTRSVIAREGGRSSTPRQKLCIPTIAAAYWMPRSSRGMTE